MDVLGHLDSLHRDLESFEPWRGAPEQLVAIFNALLATVKGQVDNPVVDAMEALRMGNSGVASHANCGTVRVAAQQLMRAVEGDE